MPAAPKSWADDHIAKLRSGEEVTLVAHGRSMEPIFYPGVTVTLTPTPIWKHLSGQENLVGRIVLVTCAKGTTFLHRVAEIVEVDKWQRWYLIANCGGTHGINTNGWVTEDKIHGVVVHFVNPTPG